MAAGIMIIERRMAETDVSPGNILSHQGSIKAIAPIISEMPIKRTRGIDKFSTPVWPFSWTNFLIEKIDLFTPEYMNVAAVTI
jgi:hypothetical protein